MSGQIKVGPLWLPFTAQQESGQQAFAWTARVGVGRCTPLVVTDRYDADGGLTAGRLLSRRTLFRTTGPDTTRSAAGRVALEACAFAMPGLLPHLGVVWSAESDELIIARWQVGTEAVTVRVRLHASGAVRAVSTQRWGGRVGTPDYQYIACGGELADERRFGDFTVPTRMTVSWWYGGAGAAPFFRARLRDFAAVD